MSRAAPVRTRCPWSEGGDLLRDYHDTEWGVPVHDDRLLFEHLLLDAFQAGLSWAIILRKREAFRRAFAGFDPEAVARFGPVDVERLLQDERIVRNRQKVEAAIGNARAYLEVAGEHGSFDAYLWDFVDGAPVQNAWEEVTDVPALTDTSKALSRDLVARGFRFAGPTICYAFMQAVGMVNDHLVDCFRHAELRSLAT